MKGKMPKKIYLFDYNEAMLTPLKGDTVYVREDAFIKSATEWLQGFMECSNLFEYQVPESEQKRVIEDFKNHMLCQSM